MNETTRIPASTSLSAWLDKLAQPDGAPGGGAACGVMLALSAALLRMVAEYTPDDERAEECEHGWSPGASMRSTQLETDGVRSAELGAALRTPTDDPDRDERVRDAATEAARLSAALGEIGVGLMTSSASSARSAIRILPPISLSPVRRSPPASPVPRSICARTSRSRAHMVPAKSWPPCRPTSSGSGPPVPRPPASPTRRRRVSTTDLRGPARPHGFVVGTLRACIGIGRVLRLREHRSRRSTRARRDS